MTNEMKLLRAFIEAQGYEVEESKSTGWFDTGIGDPTIKEQYEVIDYKVTKKVKDNRSAYACTKCGTHIAKGNSITSCLCKSSKNLVVI